MQKITLGIVFIFLGFLTPVSALAASLSLSPSSGTFKKSCSFSTDIVVDTQSGQVDGVDAIILYDTSRFSAKDPIRQGTIFADYPGTNIDDTNGKITISGLAAVDKPFASKGTLATIDWTVKDNASVGVTQIKFDFDPNDKTKTTDSNVVEHGTTNELLSAVTNGSYTIAATGSCASPALGVGGPGGAGGVGTPSSQLKTIDQFVDQTGKGPGTPELTFTLGIIGSILTVLGILGLAVL